MNTQLADQPDPSTHFTSDLTHSAQVLRSTRHHRLPVPLFGRHQPRRHYSPSDPTPYPATLQSRPRRPTRCLPPPPVPVWRGRGRGPQCGVRRCAAGAKHKCGPVGAGEEEVVEGEAFGGWRGRGSCGAEGCGGGEGEEEELVWGGGGGGEGVRGSGGWIWCI